MGKTIAELLKMRERLPILPGMETKFVSMYCDHRKLLRINSHGGKA